MEKVTVQHSILATDQKCLALLMGLRGIMAGRC
jgi:hypothetical protein